MRDSFLGYNFISEIAVSILFTISSLPRIKSKSNIPGPVL